MIDGSTIYWISRLDHIRSFMMSTTILFSILTAVAVMALVAVSANASYLETEERKSWLRIFGISTGAAASFLKLGIRCQLCSGGELIVDNWPDYDLCEKAMTDFKRKYHVSGCYS